MEVNRPQQKLQSSRKGKSAWRKNIDIDDVEAGLEAQREDLRLLGTENVDELNPDALFTVDTEGDDKIRNKYTKDAKTLKSTEILQQRSKAPALTVERNNRKIQGVSKKEVHRLMKLAGKVQGETQTKTIYEKQGLINTKADHDLWGEEKADSKKKSKPEIYEKYSAISYTPATKIPETLKEEPIKLKENVIVPHAGKSYNPSLESWESLISTEFKSEKEKEDKRIELEKEKDRVQNMINDFDDKGELSSDGSEDENEEVEEANEKDASSSLSINVPVQRNQKTKAQRNKEKRFKERQALEKELKELKAQIKELEKLPEIVSSVDAKSVQQRNKKRKTKLFKYENIDQQLEVKLSDELTDSLRSLKPEGNLLYDEMMKLQNNGKVESRKIVYKKRKYAPKVTEKWTYKDFK